MFLCPPESHQRSAAIARKSRGAICHSQSDTSILSLASLITSFNGFGDVNKRGDEMEFRARSVYTWIEPSSAFVSQPSWDICQFRLSPGDSLPHINRDRKARRGEKTICCEIPLKKSVDAVGAR
jgi:hypothetical protein